MGIKSIGKAIATNRIIEEQRQKPFIDWTEMKSRVTRLSLETKSAFKFTDCGALMSLKGLNLGGDDNQQSD